MPLTNSPVPNDDHPGLFTCAKDLGIQSIFSYKNITSPSSKGGRLVLSHEGKTTFYASKVPSKFEKVDLYVTDGDGDGDPDEVRKVEVEIEWRSS